MKVSTYLTILAVVYAAAGVAIMAALAQVLASDGVTLDPSGELVARTGATGTLAFAVIFWIARTLEKRRGPPGDPLGNAVGALLNAIVFATGALSGVAAAGRGVAQCSVPRSARPPCNFYMRARA